MSLRRTSLIAFASAAVMLSACQRTPTDNAATSSETVAEAPVEAPVVEEPFVVEGTASGEEAMVDNVGATPTPVPSDSPDTATSSTSSTDATDPHAGKPDNSSVKATSFLASGNEPFWNFDVDDKMMVFKTLENQSGWMLPVSRSGEGSKVVYSGVHEGKAFSFTLNKRTCMDSMSGAKFDYAVTGTLNGNRYDGCARGQ